MRCRVEETRKGEERRRAVCRQEAKVSPDLPTVGEHHKGGEEEVELLLDAEAPAMRERVELERAGALVKVSGR